jgi:hypothetical protein
MSQAEDPDLRALLRTLSTKARDDLRRVLIHDQADRDAISSQLIRYRDQNGDDWADIIDFLAMYPEARRQVACALEELDATQQFDGSRNEIPASNDCLPLGSVSVQRA